MRPERVLFVALVVMVCVLASHPRECAQATDTFAAHGNVQITLKTAFIKDYKSRVTITAEDFVIDKAHARPNPASKDGDMHVAGRADSIALPIVAEIMNAKDQKEAVKKVHDLEGSGKKVKVTGVWRLWAEHAGTSRQVQGDPLNDPFTTTNPDHVFEIHPITSLADIDVTTSFKPIKGFEPKDAHDAFVTYENVRCKIRPNGDTVTLITSMAGYNYVEFILELNEDPVKLDDGYAAQCKVRDLEGELLVRNRRMMFAKGTAPADTVSDLKKGKRMHVLGIPRIDLALVNYRVEHASDKKWKDMGEDPLQWNLPYEIVVVAVYPTGVVEND
jgi:hypothetical protein